MPGVETLHPMGRLMVTAISSLFLSFSQFLAQAVCFVASFVAAFSLLITAFSLLNNASPLLFSEFALPISARLGSSRSIQCFS